MKNNIIYLQHIFDSIKKIEKYLVGMNYNNFSKDDKTVDAVIRQLEIIGEAANNLDNDFKKNYPQIPFRNMIEMRNFLIHEYFGVNKKVVWDTCKIDLKSLKEIIKSYL